MNERSVILLDLDHTLVHTLDVHYPGFELIPHETLYIHVRPYVREFLSHLMQHDDLFEFGFWTCGTAEYANDVVQGLLRLVDAADWPLRILLSRQDAVVVDGSYVKDLRLVRQRFGATDLLLLDDNPIHLRIATNATSVCLVPPFFASNPAAPQDRFLMNLAQQPIAPHPDPSPPMCVHRPCAVRPTPPPEPW